MTDPVLERRARMAALAALGQRFGYAAIGVAMIAFIWALVGNFPAGATTVVAAALAIATVTLAPAIVLGYAVKAAEREDRERGL